MPQCRLLLFLLQNKLSKYNSAQTKLSNLLTKMSTQGNVKRMNKPSESSWWAKTNSNSYGMRHKNHITYVSDELSSGSK